MRFYTNPFRKDAETVWMVSASEPQFAGYSVLPSGVFADYYRTVTYSDGSTRNELYEQRPSDFIWGTSGLYTQGRGYRMYYPDGLPEMSRRFHADKR